MFPTLRHSEKILITEIPASGIKIRDILVYKGNNYNVSHRVVKIVNTPEELIFYTKGDYSRLTEEVREERLLGKVVGVYRKERLKSLSFESSLLYYLFINILSLTKEALKKAFETVYSLSFMRKVFKLFFSLEVDYLFIGDVEQKDDFKSFYNFYPFPGNKYSSTSGFLAKYKNNPVGKLWILSDLDGRFFLYGPYVKVLYRARGIGSRLIQEALRYLKAKGIKNSVYVFLPSDKSLLRCFMKSGFSCQKETNGTAFLKKFL